eukprot:scaffold24378_cov19-Prasinocladus_malaysianus.AAC.1
MAMAIPVLIGGMGLAGTHQPGSQAYRGRPSSRVHHRVDRWRSSVRLPLTRHAYVVETPTSPLPQAYTEPIQTADEFPEPEVNTEGLIDMKRYNAE